MVVVVVIVVVVVVVVVVVIIIIIIIIVIYNIYRALIPYGPKAFNIIKITKNPKPKKLQNYIVIL